MKYKRLNLFVEAKQFPDNGPQQHEVKNWIIANGGVAHLYDGAVQNDVQTSTNANWRWANIAVDGANRFANVGDWIAKEGNTFDVYTKEEFSIRFIPCA